MMKEMREWTIWMSSTVESVYEFSGDWFDKYFTYPCLCLDEKDEMIFKSYVTGGH